MSYDAVRRRNVKIAQEISNAFIVCLVGSGCGVREQVTNFWRYSTWYSTGIWNGSAYWARCFGDNIC
jgi:hypothetical protein